MKYFKAPALSMNFSESKKTMKKRFDNILDLNEKSRGIFALGLVVLGVFVVGTLVGCSNNKDVTKDGDLQIKGGVESDNTMVTDLETAVSQAILNREKGRYSDGECAAEGHIIFGNEDKVDATTNNVLETYVYALVSYGEYGFENGIFTKVSGSMAIPTKLTFARDGEGVYSLVAYEVTEDGSRYEQSVKDMFPSDIANRALKYTDSDRDELIAQEIKYVKAYLANVRSNAEVEQNVPKTLANMNTEASNALLDLFYEYPYWIGTDEKIENGVRYVYEKQWEDKGNGNGIVTFRKYEYDSKDVVEETIIEVIGDKLDYLKGDVRTNKGV